MTAPIRSMTELIEALRGGKGMIAALRGTQVNNSGYQLVKLHRDNECKTTTLHRLVALAFVPGGGPTMDVNHKDGAKANCRADNLEWVTRSQNHLHAVGLGLNTQAVAVTDPTTGVSYPSISQAARGARRSHRTVAATFGRTG